MSRSPLFQVTFGLLNAAPSKTEPGLNSMDFTLQTARYDLELHLWDRTDGIKGFFAYNTSLFDRKTIERAGRHFQQLVENAIADPTRPVSTLSMLTNAELQQLTRVWGQMRRDSFAPKCIHHIVEEQAFKNPVHLLSFPNRDVSVIRYLIGTQTAWLLIYATSELQLKI